MRILKFNLLNRWSAIIHDFLWIPLVLVLSYWLRFNLESIPAQFQNSLIGLIVLAIPIQGVFFWKFGLYRGVWRFASIPDLVRITQSVCLGTICLVCMSAMINRVNYVPRSVFFLYPLLLTTGLSLSRISYRWYKDHHFCFRTQTGLRTVIVGAGRAGEMLVRDIKYRDEYHVVAFVDDNEQLHSREIHGVSVVGAIEGLEKIARAMDAGLILIAIPSADKLLKQRIVAQCTRIEIPYKILPSVFETAAGPVSIDKMRPVTVEDLLGREVVEMNYDAISGYLARKVVLVTGGGGSIGTELCRQIAVLEPKQLIILESSEFNLYTIEQEFLHDFPSLNVEIVLGDIKDSDRMHWLFSTFEPAVVFHAAAYKHVPMLESNPAEAVRNNVIGTQVVADAADHFNAERFVLISTDKAVNPTSIMGTTKRIGELYCQNFNKFSKTRFVTTRFGNVLGSAGSVVPLFEKQIKFGGPITVTHPQITRYFMTIPEAVILILQAGSMGKGGEIFVLDMGDPVRIKDLAVQMIKLSGLEPEKDISIVFTGLRPGEKLYEELLHKSEGLQSTSHEKLMLAQSREVDWNWLLEEIAGLKQVADTRDISRLHIYLQTIVPEYSGAGKSMV